MLNNYRTAVSPGFTDYRFNGRTDPFNLSSLVSELLLVVVGCWILSSESFVLCDDREMVDASSITVAFSREFQVVCSVIFNLKFEQVMRNLTCVDQQILLMVIWLVLTRVETEEISYERLSSCFSWTCFSGWVGGGGSVGGRWNWTYFGLLLGGSNAREVAQFSACGVSVDD